MTNAIALSERTETIRIVVADSTSMHSQLLADNFARDKRFAVCGIAAEEKQLLAAVTDHIPDVVVLSAHFQNTASRGFEIARKVRVAAPYARVVLLLDTSERSATLEAFRSGARGVFSRVGSLDMLSKCVLSVYTGQIWANSRELQYLVEAFSGNAPVSMLDTTGVAKLSNRERDVVHCVAEGLTNREIAKRLGLTEHTIKNYLFRIFDKLGVSSRVELVLCAFSLDRVSFTRPSPSLAPPRSAAASLRVTKLEPFSRGPNIVRPLARISQTG
jgi:two-component system nitrate/nitrite response regulator NarL